MASEVAILHWCDVCYRDGNKVPPVFTITLSAGVQRNQKIELCDDHNQPIPLAQLENFLADFGTDDKDVPAPKGRTGEHQCPQCHTVLGTRGSLTAHARQAHGKTLSQLEIALGLPVSGNPGYSMTGQRTKDLVCEVCGKDYTGPQGLAAHKRAAHGIPGKTASRGQPTLIAS